MRRQLKSLAAEVCYRSGILKLLSNVETRVPSILTYHRVVDPETLPFEIEPGMFVRPETFAQHLKLLKQEAEIISFAEMLLGLGSGIRFPPRTVVLTFDDGWRDSYLYALPTLKAEGIPAAVFLPTNYIGQQCETHCGESLFWTDELSVILSMLGSDLSHAANQIALLQHSGFSHISDLFNAWVKQVDDRVRRREALADIVACLKRIDPETRKKILVALKDSELGSVRVTAPMQRQFLNWQEVREMSKCGISFYSHSHEHNSATEVSEAALIRDVDTSFEILERELGQKHERIFCYPGGNFSHRTQVVLREAAVSYALGTDRISYWEDEPPVLGRIGIHEDVSYSRAMFAYRLWMPN